MDRTRYRRTLKRNLNEVSYAKYQRATVLKMQEEGKKFYPGNFLSLTFASLSNDMISHLIKVLDKDPQSATFWYANRIVPDKVKAFFEKKGYDIGVLETVSHKLKTIRDRTHFHIDKRDVLDPERVWLEANLTGKDIDDTIAILYEALNFLHIGEFEKPFPAVPYDEKEVTAFVKFGDSQRAT